MINICDVYTVVFGLMYKRIKAVLGKNRAYLEAGVVNANRQIQIEW